METSQPCYNPDERQDQSYFFPNEVGRVKKLGAPYKRKVGSYVGRSSNECTESNGHKTDTRFQKIQNFSISEYSLQEASGVFEILRELPYESEIPLKSLKEEEMYSFYVRPTIPWDI